MAGPFRLNDSGAAASIHFELAFDWSRRQGSDRELAGFEIRELDCKEFTTAEDIFRAVGVALGFPHESTDYAGNPNAFLDWLTDLSWIEGLQGIVVVLHSSHILWARWPFFTGVLIELWLRAAQSWEKDGIPCHLVFDLPARLGSLTAPGSLA